MKRQRRGPSAGVLLDLVGQVLVVDSKGEYWVRFSVGRVASTKERPHGLRYSLTLHGSEYPGYLGPEIFQQTGWVFELDTPRTLCGAGGLQRGPHNHATPVGVTIG